MSVEEAILELLKVHNRVILPGFGAFLVAKEDSAEKPYVLFNGFLSFNDGLLIDYLAEKNGVDSIVASDYGAEYVFNLKTALQEEKIYKFNFLGTFDFDESGGMRFRYNPNVGRTPQKPGAHAKPQPKEEPKKDVKSEKKQGEVKQTTKSDLVKPVEPKIEQKSEETKIPALSSLDQLLDIDNSSSPSVVIDSAPSSVSSKIDAGNSSFELEDEKLSAPKNLTQVREVKAEKIESNITDSPENQSEGRGRLTVAIVAVLLVFIFVGGYFYFYYLPHKTEAAARQKAMEFAVKQKEERIKLQSDSLAAVKDRELALADSLRIVEESTKVIKNGYHLIIGAFAEEKNADKLLAKVQITFPRAQKISYRNRFMVSVDVYTTKEEAQNHLANVTQSLQMDCWVHRN